jgi:hypothetical protein
VLIRFDAQRVNQVVSWMTTSMAGQRPSDFSMSLIWRNSWKIAAPSGVSGFITGGGAEQNFEELDDVRQLHQHPVALPHTQRMKPLGQLARADIELRVVAAVVPGGEGRTVP